MTAYNARLNGKKPKGHNRKDGPGRRRRRPGQDWEGHGFSQIDWNKWVYTWEGVFPVFRVAPGVSRDESGFPWQGLVARCSRPEVEVLFPYGTGPEEIKGRLDEEILAIMRHEAALVDCEIDDELVADLDQAAEIG
jgi:hypothetical protein